MVHNSKIITYVVKYYATYMFMKYFSKHEERREILKTKQLQNLNIFILDWINRTYHTQEGADGTIH